MDEYPSLHREINIVLLTSQALKLRIAILPYSPSEFVSSEHWLSDFINLSNMPPHILWSSVPSGKYKSVDISPGGQVSGFGFQSPNAPGLIQYNAQGDTGVPSATPGPLDDEPLPNCPDWDFESPKFQTLVTGIATGPLALQLTRQVRPAR